MFCNTDQYVSKTTYEMYIYVNWPEMLAKWPRSLVNWLLAKWLLGKTTTNTNASDRYTNMNSRKSACSVKNNSCLEYLVPKWITNSYQFRKQWNEKNTTNQGNKKRNVLTAFLALKNMVLWPQPGSLFHTFVVCVYDWNCGKAKLMVG